MFETVHVDLLSDDINKRDQKMTFNKQYYFVWQRILFCDSFDCEKSDWKNCVETLLSLLQVSQVREQLINCPFEWNVWTSHKIL